MWAHQTLEQSRPLPLDLRFTDDGIRLYSGRFYQVALEQRPPRTPRRLIHAPAKESRPEIWAFELEYTDQINHPELGDVR